MAVARTFSLGIVGVVIGCLLGTGCAVGSNRAHVVSNPDPEVIGHLVLPAKLSVQRRLPVLCRAFQRQVDPDAVLNGDGVSTAGDQQAAFVAVVQRGRSPWSARPIGLPLATCDYRATTAAALRGLQVVKRGGSYFTAEALIDGSGEWTANPGISLDD